MKTSSDIAFLVNQITTWAGPLKGTVGAATDIVHLFALLSVKPGGFRVAVKWMGEDKRNELEETGMVDARFWIALSFGNSMMLNKADALYQPSATGQAWADTVESCRDFIRGLKFDPLTTEQGPNYLGCKQLVEIAPDFLLDGNYLEFTIGKLMPPPPPGPTQLEV